MSEWLYTETEIWKHGTDKYSLFHVFGLTSYCKYVWIFAEARQEAATDSGCPHDITMRMSRDAGRSFETSRVLLSDGHCWTNPVPVFDKIAQTLFLFYSDNVDNVYTRNYYMVSTDFGCTWEEPVDITDHLNNKTRLPIHLAGPGHGLQLKSGRLILPIWHRLPLNVPIEKRNYCSSMLMSDNHGKDWKLIDQVYGSDQRVNEARIVETEESLLWSLRATRNPVRYSSRSIDNGDTWSALTPMSISPAVNCDAGAISHNFGDEYCNVVLISRPSWIDKRRDMEILLSNDGGKTFSDRFTMPNGDAMPGYSDMCMLEDDIIGVLHCRSNHVLFSRISLQTITNGKQEHTERNVWLV